MHFPHMKRYFAIYMPPLQNIIYMCADPIGVSKNDIVGEVAGGKLYLVMCFYICMYILF